MKRATKVIKAGMLPPRQGEPFSGGVTFAGTYHLSGDPSSSPFIYGRYHNPTWAQFERALSDLEGGMALSFASGMAAIAAVLGTALKPNDILVMPSDSYYAARMLAEGFFKQTGVQIKKAPTARNEQMKYLDGAKLLWLESPSNPGLEVCDIKRLAKTAHDKGVRVAVDNTTPTVLGQRPLELGADFSVASDTKSLTGHSDLILGHVAVQEKDLFNKLQGWRNQIGAVPGPMETYLAYRSLATLEMRISRQTQNALEIAKFLSIRSEVKNLRYPGLPVDPSYPIASQQMEYYGPIVSFTLEDRRKAEGFLNHCELIIQATSFGGVHTMAERRGRWGGDAVPEGFIRLSAGCEDIEDILSDIKQALEAIKL